MWKIGGKLGAALIFILVISAGVAATNVPFEIDQFGYSGWDYRMIPWFWGSDWVNEDVTKSLVDSPITIYALERWAELPLVHRITPGATVDHEVTDQALAGGRMAMRLFGTYSLPIIMAQVQQVWDGKKAARPALEEIAPRVRQLLTTGQFR